LYNRFSLGYNDEWIGANPMDSISSNHNGTMECNPVIWEKMGDPILHIQLRNWADIALVVPLSAHTLAKLSNGLCDDLLSCILRAWDYSNISDTTLIIENDNTVCTSSPRGKPILLAPAMNTAMWDHPITQKQLDSICAFGSEHWERKSNESLIETDDGVTHSCLPSKSKSIVRIIQPQIKKLACGEHGNGALADLSYILAMTKECLYSRGFTQFRDI